MTRQKISDEVRRWCVVEQERPGPKPGKILSSHDTKDLAVEEVRRLLSARHVVGKADAGPWLDVKLVRVDRM